MLVAACEDYMTTIQPHYSESLFTLAAEVLLRRWIEREHLNHGSMYRLETGNRLRQVLIPCNPFITIAAIDVYARHSLTHLRWLATKKDSLLLFVAESPVCADLSSWG